MSLGVPLVFANRQFYKIFIGVLLLLVGCSKFKKNGGSTDTENETAAQSASDAQKSKSGAGSETETVYLPATYTKEQVIEFLPGLWEESGQGQLYLGRPGGPFEIHFFHDRIQPLNDLVFRGSYQVISNDSLLLKVEEMEVDGRSLMFQGALVNEFQMLSPTQLELKVTVSGRQVCNSAVICNGILNKISGSSSSSGKQVTREQLIDQLREPIPAVSDAAAEKVITNYLKVKGGEQRLAAIRTIEVTGKLREGLQDYKVIFWESPNHSIRLEKSHLKLGRVLRSVYAYNGRQAWSQEHRNQQVSAVQKIGPADIPRLFKSTAFHGSFIHPEQMGLIFKYEGKIQSRGRESYLVKLFRPDGTTELLYFDTTNFMLTRHSWKEIVQGTILKKDTFFSQYQRVDGIWVPEVIEFAMGDQLYGKFTVETYTINPEVELGFYAMP